ncbi:hypothetical protein B005_4418 [Nocardiopsis alba ATCC BAA-2165]|uniref:Uncharacterized protein n=1 Tax=Nocardiopsis alba (strain ATCC BAA-2165 / BE74) TaxID=1205910 RepID=J7L283_NOCAA|nr:hypothetical protein B005_4418 [Nocardiopsis alba ATCC BAA-2165]
MVRAAHGCALSGRSSEGTADASTGSAHPVRPGHPHHKRCPRGMVKSRISSRAVPVSAGSLGGRGVLGGSAVVPFRRRNSENGCMSSTYVFL